MQRNNELNQKVGDALKAYNLIAADAETTSQYFIEIERMNGEDAPMTQLQVAFSDFDVNDVYTGADALSGFSNGYLFTVRQSDQY